MSLHRLVSMQIGVPAPADLAGFYAEVGLGVDDRGGVTSPDGGTQIVIEEAPFRRLVGVRVGTDDERDLDAIVGRLETLGLSVRSDADGVHVVDPTTQVVLTAAVSARLEQVPPAAEARLENRPGSTVRRNRRAPGVFEGARPPRRLGHLVLGTPDIAATRRVLVDGLGFKVSDEFEGVISFLRCSTDHHNVALVHSPVPLLQHYSWECDDADHVGHAATALLRADGSRQVWGFGRHFVGSNTYWYLRDPAGSFLELFSDMDLIDDDEEWEAHGRTPVGFEHVANSWGPDIPLEFIVPSDLDELQAGWAGQG